MLAEFVDPDFAEPLVAVNFLAQEVPDDKEDEDEDEDEDEEDDEESGEDDGNFDGYSE